MVIYTALGQFIFVLLFRMNSSPSSGSVSPFSLSQDKCQPTHNQISNSVSLHGCLSLIMGVSVQLFLSTNLHYTCIPKLLILI